MATVDVVGDRMLGCPEAFSSRWKVIRRSLLSYAKGMDQGQRLYVDLWDNKQPGIFWFYLAAGNTFGFTAIGLHVLEWLWLACTALMLRQAASAAFISAWVVELVPLFTIGLYYWCAWSWFMTQIEILVAMPLAGCIAEASAIGSRYPERAPWMHAAFGACAAVVVAFKLVLVVVPIALWLVWVGYSLASLAPTTREQCPSRHAVAGPAWRGCSTRARCSAFRAQRILERICLGLLCLAPPCPAGTRRQARLRSVRRGALADWRFTSGVGADLDGPWRSEASAVAADRSTALSWLVAGTLAILVQRFSWWGYHLLLLMPAIGLIAASACDRLAANTMATPAHGSSGRRTEQIAALALVAMFVLYPMQTLRGLRAAVRRP